MRRILKISVHGFSLVEMMVGVVIFIVGILGFSGMTLIQSQGNRVAKGNDEAATLLQSIVENLSNVRFNDLGNDASFPTFNGLSAANVWTDGPLNRIGQPIGTGTGPYSYYRSVVICSAATAGVGTGGTPQYCGSSLSGANRPAELACNNISPALSAREKLIRVLVGWSDRSGRCHYKVTNSLSFNW